MLQTKAKLIKFQNIFLNFGPQHPAAHGVLRLILELQGERVVHADPHIGLLHRGTEKLLEYKTFLQGLPYFDRLDYVSMLAQEHAYCLAVEHIFDFKVSLRSQYLRVIFLEITRILNHLLSITTHAFDVGAMTPILWGFEEREKLMGFYEYASGARMHAALFRPGGLAYDIPLTLLAQIFWFTVSFSSRLNEMEELLTFNRIWQKRLKRVGTVTRVKAFNWGFSGPMLRSTGTKWDLRKATPYEAYRKFKFTIPFGIYGDCFDRFLIRIEEFRQSLNIIQQAVNLTPQGVVDSESFRTSRSSKSMEALILSFKNKILYRSKSTIIKKLPNEVATYQEAPKGEFGVYVITKDFLMPYRLKIKSPGLLHLQAMEELVSQQLIADVVTIIGTQDIVFGEIDR